MITTHVAFKDIHGIRRTLPTQQVGVEEMPATASCRVTYQDQVFVAPITYAAFRRLMGFAAIEDAPRPAHTAQAPLTITPAIPSGADWGDEDAA